ncbi:MAG: N-acetylmuramoyl-L-alanine amidase, partial [Bacteroidales bacterium]|nr:N-acetylmuramoyl-L-alanine amidase [Bacteroidales bacterium]
MLGMLPLRAETLKLRTVVIDAGHGGKDAGAVSKDKKTYEKTFTLAIASKLSEKIKEEYPDIKVVMTRSTDKFVELRDRAAIANKAGGQLFISIHINSAYSTSPNGYSVHILGQSSNKNRDLFAYNMDVVKRENSVILLEDDYSTKYQGFDPSDEQSYIFMSLMQNAHLEQSLLVASIISEKLKGGPVKADRGIWQDPFYVLWKTAMPSVLVELGFISNANDLSILKQEKNRDELAVRLFEAFKESKTVYDGSLDL